MSNYRSQNKPRVALRDSVRDEPTKQGSEVKPDSNQTINPPVFEPVPEERARFDLLSCIKDNWVLLSIIVGASVAGATFLKFQSDLSDAHEKLSKQAEIIALYGAEDVALDRRLIKVEKDIGFIDQRLKLGEAEIRDLKKLSSFLEKQQAVLSDRSNRSFKDEPAGE